MLTVDGSGPRLEKQSELGEQLLQDLMDALDSVEVWRKFVETCGGSRDASVVRLQDMKLLAERMVFMAGSVCKDFSSMNQGRQELLGSYILPFAVSLALVRYLNPMVFWHECTRLFKPKVFEATLPMFSRTSWLLDPQDFGFPVRRSRVYTALLRDGISAVRDKKDIRNLFSPTRMTSSAFFQATDEEAVDFFLVRSVRYWSSVEQLDYLFVQRLPGTTNICLLGQPSLS